MSFEAARCPNCGAVIQVQSDGEYAYCSYCGSRLVAKQAIATFRMELALSDPVIVNGVSSIENDLLRGEQCLEARDWEEAYQHFSTAVDKDADNGKAWYGCLRAMTAEFTEFQSEISDPDGDKGITAVIIKSMRYSSAVDRGHLLRKMETPYGQLLDKYTKIRKKIIIFNSLLLLSLILFFVTIGLVFSTWKTISEETLTLVIFIGVVPFFVTLATGRTNETTIKISGEKLYKKLLAVQDALGFNVPIPKFRGMGKTNRITKYSQSGNAWRK